MRNFARLPLGCLLVFPVAAQRGGGMRGGLGNVRGGFGSGLRHGGFVGSGFGRFRGFRFGPGFFPHHGFFPHRGFFFPHQRLFFGSLFTRIPIRVTATHRLFSDRCSTSPSVLGPSTF